jgi:hypothetical protein
MIKSPSPRVMEILKDWRGLATAGKVLQKFGSQRETVDADEIFAITSRSKSVLHKFIDRSMKLQTLFEEVRFIHHHQINEIRRADMFRKTSGLITPSSSIPSPRFGKQNLSWSLSVFAWYS